MKKYRKAKGKKKLAEAKIREKMTDEEYDARVNNKHTPSLKDQLKIALWDFEHDQYPPVKYDKLIEMLEARIAELDETMSVEKNKLEVTINAIRRKKNNLSNVQQSRY